MNLFNFRARKELIFSTGEVSVRRLKLWAESFEELLSDEAGREILEKFLDKEYSGENLRFWWKVLVSNSFLVDIDSGGLKSLFELQEHKCFKTLIPLCD